MSVIQDFIAAFFEQPPRILIVMGLVLFGWIIKKNENLISAKWIPVILPVLGIIAFPVALGEGVRTIGKLAVEGFVGGCLAVWINQAYRQLFSAKFKGSSVDDLLGASNEKEENDQTHKEETGTNACGCVSCVQHCRPGNASPDTGMHQSSEPNHPQ